MVHKTPFLRPPASAPGYPAENLLKGINQLPHKSGHQGAGIGRIFVGKIRIANPGRGIVEVIPIVGTEYPVPNAESKAKILIPVLGFVGMVDAM